MSRYLTSVLFSFMLSATLVAQIDCVITNLTVTPRPCINGMFLVDVNFDIVNPDGNIFGIVGNATNYGFFMYDDRPVTLGPLAGDGETVWTFIVYDLGEPNCQATYVLGIQDCCSITNVQVDQIACTGLTTYRARVNLSHSNTGGVGFQVYSETGGLLGTYQYANLPVIVENIPSFRIGTTHLRICDLGSSTCCTIREYPDPDCNPNDCEIYNLSVSEGECENGRFPVTINFNHQNGGAGFSVTGNGNHYGTYPFSALPLTLHNLEGDGSTVYEFVITGAGMGPNCNTAYVLGTVSCPPGCGFNDVEIEPLECCGDTAYFLRIDFTPVANSGEGFSVYQGAELLGTFSYDDVPVIVECFPYNGGFFEEIELCDNVDPDCCYTFEFQALRCDGCVIHNFNIQPMVCDDNGQFRVLLNFYYHNVESDSFQIFGNGFNFGKFGYNQLPLNLGPFDGDAVTFYEFLVLDLGGGFCFGGGEMGIVDCDCTFEEITVQPIECTGNNRYSLVLDFTPVSVSNSGFDVYAGDQFVGYFLYENLPVTIPSFPYSGGAFDILMICDNDNPTCCVTIEFPGLDCFCGIFELVAEPSECDTATGTFDLHLDFEWIGLVETFNVFLGNTLVGTVVGADLPITLEGLSTNIGAALIRVCAIGHPECCSTVEIDNPCKGPCEIFDLSVEASACDTLTNTFDLHFNFGWIGDIETFDVFFNDAFIGVLEGAALPGTITGLMTTGGVAQIRVCGNDRPDCCRVFELAIDECRVIPCEIFEVVANPGTCTSDSTFTLFVNFAYQGLGSDSVEIWTGGTFIGAFVVDSLPFTITHFPWNGEPVMPLRICSSADAECCRTIEFETPFCGCEIVRVTAEALGTCNPDNETFPVYLDIEWIGDVTAFSVFAGDQFIGIVNAATLPDTLNTFPLPGGEIAELRVCATDDPECCATRMFEVPDCDLCTIREVTVDTFMCTGANTFSAWIDYVAIGFDGPLEIWADDTYLGIHPQSHPLLLLNVPESDDNILLRICQAGNEECCTEFEFRGMTCPDSVCIIGALTTQIQVIDSAYFSATLNFNYNNVGVAFSVAGNGVLYGVFTYNNVPLLLDSLRCEEGKQWEFAVLDLQNIGCNAVLHVGEVSCSTDAVSDTRDSVLPLEIRYGGDGAYALMPQHAQEMSLWTYDGKLIAQRKDVTPGQIIHIDPMVPVPGLFIVRVRSTDHVYIGKVVRF